MNIKIITLSENTATAGFIAEWGLSILIEVDNKRILLDTGSSFSTVYNAQLAGIDIRVIDTIVLSHGHFDHTGGLKDILARRNEKIDIIAHPSIWEAKYSIRENNKRYIGIPFARELLEGMGGRFVMSRQPVWIADNIVTSGEIPLTTDYEEIDQTLYVKEKDAFKPDTLHDDLSLAIKTESGLMIFLGCAHRGMINTIRHFQKITGDDRVYSVVGGTHLISASPDRLDRTIADLKKTGIRKLGVSHCTGFEASARLATEFKDIFFLNCAGSIHKLL
jgi:7,8-dihydropterin-6-yl-methyl-4-(beta-D-ribofuranosyl)aminobenzene 5'-phosphate synthase